MRKKYSIGIDFGTLSARAILIETHSGDVIATSVYGYQDAIIDKYLPNSNQMLPIDFALQNPKNYLDALVALLRDIWRSAGIDPKDIISIGTDFTSCTVIPLDKNNMPLCFDNRYMQNPHSWAKLWKHHGAKEEADTINNIAVSRGEKFIDYYGGISSCEWYFAKLIEIYNKAPEIYNEISRFVEAGDWIVWLLTGNMMTSTCMAGYKAFWNEESGYPSKEFFEEIDPDLGDIVNKTVSKVVPVCTRAGGLTKEMAQKTGLLENTSVSVSMIDAHVSLPVAGITGESSLQMTMGTSLCHTLVSKKRIFIKGISGVVKDGILQGYYGYEAGQAAVGDIYDWFITNFAPVDCIEEAEEKDISIFSIMDERARRIKPGKTGLLVLDWWNGNRSMLNNANLTGTIIGMTLMTQPEEVYKAIIEATAFGTRKIIEEIENNGINLENIFACGGLSRKSSLVMQVFADVLGRKIEVTNITQTTAFGAAMYGIVAAGSANGGYDNMIDAIANLVKPAQKAYVPNKKNYKVYSKLYEQYIRLHNLLGIDNEDIMLELKKMKGDL